MQELKRILTEHAARYPLMEAQDVVKLIYQNEFGAAHMIKDEAACRAALRTEYAATPKNSLLPRYEDIGNGMVRIHLAALAENELEALGTAFIAGAGAAQGTLSRFRAKLSLLETLTAEGLLPFSTQALTTYLAAYEAAGFPAVSHSETYRAAYRPAYRVVPHKV